MTGKRPTISVLLPFFNAEATLVQAVQSIQNQTWRDWELLLLNDGATDTSAQLAANLAANDSRLRLFNLPHQGLVKTLQTGLQHVAGDFIARMDADDYSFPERFALQVGKLNQHPELGVVSGLVEYGGDRQSNLGYALHVDWLNRLLTHDDIWLNRFIESPLAHPSAMFRRSIIQALGGYKDGPFPEDYELWLRWLDAGIQFAKVAQSILKWNDPPQRLSRTDERYHFEAFYRTKAPYLTKAIEKTGHTREIWIWGAGRPTRRRANLLQAHGITIHGYIDIDPKKCGQILQGRRVINPDQLPSPTQAMVIGFVAKREARQLIRNQLVKSGFIEGKDFWMAA